jgi:outer membrane receptor protein involved in Fe transport
MRFSILRLLSLAVVLLLLAAPANSLAQIDRAEVNGTVADASGAVVPGASIQIVQTATGETRNTLSSDRGTFVLSSLPIGRFTITVDKVGFSQLRIADIDLNAGVTRTINAQMKVASSAQTVDVEADRIAGELDKNDATFGGTIQSVQVARLPLNGRNIATLELLAPGAIDSGSGQQASIRFAGQGIDDNNYRFDGVDAAGGIRQAIKSGLRLQFSTEAIAEFKVAAGGYTADTGGSAGGQVSLISKSGTNSFHGSIFEYLRNNYFDALSPIKSTYHPNFHLNQFGGNLGGPVLRERTFFFVNYEGFRQTLGGIPSVGTVPSAAFRAQVIAAQPALAPWLNAYPTGSTPSATDPNAALYTAVVPSPNQENSGVIRIDHRIGAKDSMYGRYNVDDGVSTSALNPAGQAITVNSRVQNFVLEEEHIFSPTLLNEAELGFNRNTYIQNQNTGLPYNISITGFTGLSETYNKAQVPTTFSVNDTVTLTRGQHTIKAGVDIRRVYINEANSTDGTLSYTSEPKLVAGQLNSIQVTAPLNDRGLRKTQYAGYAQDQWKVTPDLTFNYGLRYNYFSPFVEGHNNEDPFDIASCNGYCGIGSEFYFRNYLDFDPRVSVAYSPSSLGGNTVFRAGFGIYHGEIQLGDEDSPVVNTEPSTTLTSSATTIYTYPAALSLIPITGLATTPRSLARNHPYSYTTQWTASVQQALGSGTTLTATYLGVKGTHLFRRSYTNLINPVTGLRPYPQYPSQIDTKFDAGMSIFHALQFNLVRRFHNGFFISGNYMFSHALDDNSVGAGEANSPQNIANPAADYANSQYDVRHTANASVVYELPFGIGRRYMNQSRILDLFAGGWSIDSLLIARGGLPVDISLSRSSSALPDGNNASQHPNYVSGQSVYGGRGIRTWLNPNAFSVPANGVFGNLHRDAAVGPTLWQDDAAVEKSFRITERNAVIFRAEAFNVFNRAQYGQPNSSLSTTTCPSNGITPYNGAPCTVGTLVLAPPATFGQITSTINSTGLVGTGTPRVLEFALRITY